jgi:hypothetical protein
LEGFGVGQELTLLKLIRFDCQKTSTHFLSFLIPLHHNFTTMKKTHIIALLVIAVAVAIIITTAGDASSYVTFDQAAQMASKASMWWAH